LKHTEQDLFSPIKFLGKFKH